MAYRSDEVTNAVVLEIGRHVTKCGYAGEDSPRALFQTKAVAVKRTTSDAEKDSGDVDMEGLSVSKSKKHYFEPLQSLPKSKENEYDFQSAVNANGIIEDWDLWMETMRHAGAITGFSEDKLFNDSPLIMIEKPHNPPGHRAKIIEMLFESTDAPAVFLGKDAVLNCFACGRTTGIVADVGDTTLITPVYEGWAESGKGMLRGVGVECIQKHCIETMDQLLKRSGSNAAKEVMPFYQAKNEKHEKRIESYHSLARFQTAVRCLEFLSPYSVAEYGYNPSNFKHIPKLPYVLPDGTEIQFGNERFEFGEILFGDASGNLKTDDAADKTPSQIREAYASGYAELLEKESSSQISPNKGESNFPSKSTPNSNNGIEFSTGTLQNMICESAFRCDREQQAQLLGNVVLAGGGVCVENVVDRARAEVEAIIHTHTPGWRVKVLSPPVTERAYCSWLGGSILGSLGSFGEMYISRKEYDEGGGASIVHRKCP